MKTIFLSLSLFFLGFCLGFFFAVSNPFLSAHIYNTLLELPKFIPLLPLFWR
jgi:hypothetical protein